MFVKGDSLSLTLIIWGVGHFKTFNYQTAICFIKCTHFPYLNHLLNALYLLLAVAQVNLIINNAGVIVSINIWDKILIV